MIRGRQNLSWIDQSPFDDRTTALSYKLQVAAALDFVSNPTRLNPPEIRISATDRHHINDLSRSRRWKNSVSN